MAINRCTEFPRPPSLTTRQFGSLKVHKKNCCQELPTSSMYPISKVSTTLHVYLCCLEFGHSATWTHALYPLVGRCHFAHNGLSQGLSCQIARIRIRRKHNKVVCKELEGLHKKLLWSPYDEDKQTCGKVMIPALGG